MKRLRRLRYILKRRCLGALLLSHSPNISYLTEYASRDSLFLVTPAEAVYFTDSRYTAEAQNRLPQSVRIRQTNGAFFRGFAETVKSMGVSMVAFEPDHVSYGWHKKLEAALGKKIRLMPMPGLVEELRQIKDRDEIAKIRKAVAITGRALGRIRPYLKPGIREIQIVGELQRIVREEGAEDVSFDIIAASGPNTSFPHHRSSSRKVRANDVVIIDMGVVAEGYRSDLTRTFFLGKINSLVQRVYDIVRQAQEEVFQRIKQGMCASSLDHAARSFIAGQGYADNFGHNLGHGVGIEVHEAPYLSGKSSAQIKPGMIFTVEPGIYLPNKFGIRIEDMVLVKHKGFEVLSGFIH